MPYEAPVVKWQGGLDDVLRGLFLTSTVPPSRRDLRVSKLIHHIDGHQGSVGWDLDGACRELGLEVSGAYAGRLFKRYAGLGVREYAKRKRLLASAELLKTTDLPVKVIAAESGYRSLPHFSRRFKQQFQLSPTEFRRSGQLGVRVRANPRLRTNAEELQYAEDEE